MAELILGYLVHHRYYKVRPRNFILKSCLSMKTSALVSSDLFEKKALNEKEDTDILARQRIYEAVLSGNIDEALSQTDAMAPGTLEKYPRILFRLRCQKFMEMVSPVLLLSLNMGGHSSSKIQTRTHTKPFSLAGLS